jgi:hypothetical protein
MLWQLATLRCELVRARVLALLGLSLFAAIREKDFGVGPYNLVPFFIYLIVERIT